MATREMEVLLEVGGFDMDSGVELTISQAHINVQKHDFGGIASVEAVKELGEGDGFMRPKDENVIDKMQPGARFLESGVNRLA